MKKAICILLFVLSINALSAVVVDEALLASTISQGTNIYNTCIAVPPITPQQKALCDSLYSVYTATLIALNEPDRLTLSEDEDPYAWSPYDVCRYETEHLIFGNQDIEPYCPTI